MTITERELMDLASKAGFGGQQRSTLKVKLLLLVKLLGIEVTK